MSRQAGFMERVFGLSEDRVVDLLRALHHSQTRSGAATEPLPALATLLRALRPPAETPRPRTELPPGLPLQPDWDESPRTDHRTGTALGDGRGSVAPSWGPMPVAPEPDSYERARTHFAGVEERLRGEARVSDELIEGLRAREPAVPEGGAPQQQSLRLIALAASVAGGRFVVSNDRRTPLELGFRHTGLREAPAGPGVAVEFEPGVRFEPASFALTPGDSQVVRIWIDLSDLPPLCGRYEMCVDVMADLRCEQKLFIEIEIHAPEGAEELAHG